MSSSIIARSKFDDAWRAYSAVFFDALQHAAGVCDPVAMMAPTDAYAVEYDFVTGMPKMREWLGERVVQRLRAEKFIITNKLFEATVGVSVDDLIYDRFGKVRPTIAGLAGSADRKRDEILTQLLIDGLDVATATGYDGQQFFDTDHTIAGDGTGSTYSNISNFALDADAIDLAQTDADAIVDEYDEPLQVEYNAIMYGPALEATVRELFWMPTLSGGAANPHFQRFGPKDGGGYIKNKRLRGSAEAYWFLFDTSKPVKGLVWQFAGNPEFIPKDFPTDDGVFWHNEAVFGTHGRMNGGYGLPALVYGSLGVS